MSMKFWRGQGDIVFCTTIANPAAPTAAEIAAGVSLGLGTNAVRGFTTTTNRIAVAVLAYDTDIQINGPATFVDSGLDLIDDDGTGSNADDVARRNAITALAVGASGYFVFSRFKKKAAMVAAAKVDVFAGQVSGANNEWTLDANVAKKIIDVTLSAAPVQNVAITS